MKAVPDTSKARGVLPKRQREDSVIRNPDANGWFVFIDLADSVDAAAAEEFLRWLHSEGQVMRGLRDPRTKRRRATLAIAVGPTFFRSTNGTLRVAGSTEIPVGLQAPPLVPNASPAGGDLLLYVMATAEEVAARFLQGLHERRPSPIASIRVERGFQRVDEREWFGHRDGVRNVAPEERDEFVWVDPDQFPEEPLWSEGGTYLAYMKVRQNVSVARSLQAGELDQIVGRREDGSRIDCDPGTAITDEPPDTSQLPAASHVRKTGPRGEGRDAVRIFRRGLPYHEMTPDGLAVGLHFASFQPSPDFFKVILNRWMLNTDFPTPGSGQDALITRGLVAFEKAGFYFVLPEGEEFTGQAMYTAAAPVRQPKRGRIAVRKVVLDANGVEVHGDLAGFKFRITDDAGTVVEELITNAAGHAQSAALELGTYGISEFDIPPTVTPDPATHNIVLESAHQLARFTNRVQPGSVYATPV